MNHATGMVAEQPVALPAPNSAGEILIATVNRAEGDTGVHAHTRALSEGLAAVKGGGRVVTPFQTGPLWLPVFAVRPLILKRLNKTWGTRWYRHWHGRALLGQLKHTLRCGAPAAIIAQCPVSAEAAMEARSQLKLRVPVAMVCHFNFSEATEYRDKGECADKATFDAMLAMEARVLERVDAVFYVSEYSRRVVEMERGIVPRFSTVIWNGIDAAVAPPSVNRESLGLKNDDVVLINVGSLEARKNQLGLLDLFARIAKEYPAAKLILVGDGPQRREIENKIDALSVRDRVQCLGFRTDVPSLFPAADLYIHYAHLENCPVILLEAARASLAVATLPAGGAQEILSALGGGALLAPDDFEASMKTLRPLLWESGARKAMGQRLRAGFDARFTQSAMVAEYMKQTQVLQFREREGAKE